MMDIGKDLQDAYEHGRQDALAELMEYTYGMLTAEKFGLQHKIKSMMADRKTENSSEIPNNSTISKMEQVDKDINVRSKDETKTKKPSCCAECKVWYRCFEEKPPYNMIKSRCPINEDEQSGKE